MAWDVGEHRKRSVNGCCCPYNRTGMGWGHTRAPTPDFTPVHQATPGDGPRLKSTPTGPSGHCKSVRPFCVDNSESAVFSASFYLICVHRPPCPTWRRPTRTPHHRCISHCARLPPLGLSLSLPPPCLLTSSPPPFSTAPRPFLGGPPQ